MKINPVVRMGTQTDVVLLRVGKTGMLSVDPDLQKRFVTAASNQVIFKDNAGVLIDVLG